MFDNTYKGSYNNRIHMVRAMARLCKGRYYNSCFLLEESILFDVGTRGWRP